jgi:hypothetical protein
MDDRVFIQAIRSRSRASSPLGERIDLEFAPLT